MKFWSRPFSVRSSAQLIEHMASKLWIWRFLRISLICYGTMIGGHCWQEIRGKQSSYRDSARHASKSLTIPVLKEHHNVKYRHSGVADILQIGWETNTSRAECGWSSVEYYCHLYWEYAFIRYYLRTGSMRLLKNMRLINVCLLIRLYVLPGSRVWCAFLIPVLMVMSHLKCTCQYARAALYY